jgi:hypothetical protein
MTKICPNCQTENQDSSEFCQNCGNKMEGIEKSTPPKTGLKGWWDKQSNGIKALSIIGVCCLGLIVIVAIGGMLSPDKTTTNVTFNNSVISFQYPKNLQVKNYSSDPADGTIIITNNGDASNGILVISQDKATYESLIAPDPPWTVKGTYKSPRGVSYRVETCTDVNGVLLTDYEVKKNGKYYEILGTASDGFLMDALVDSVN